MHDTREADNTVEDQVIAGLQMLSPPGLLATGEIELPDLTQG
jgi:hypothetical protein